MRKHKNFKRIFNACTSLCYVKKESFGFKKKLNNFFSLSLFGCVFTKYPSSSRMGCPILERKHKFLLDCSTFLSLLKPCECVSIGQDNFVRCQHL